MPKTCLTAAILLAAGICLGQTSATAPATKPESQPIPAVTSEGIDAAMDKAVQYLWSKQLENGSWGNSSLLSANVLWGLLQAGEAVQDPRTIKGLEWLNKQKEQSLDELAVRVLVWKAAAPRLSDEERDQYLPRIGDGIRALYNHDYTKATAPELTLDTEFRVIDAMTEQIHPPAEIPSAFWTQLLPLLSKKVEQEWAGVSGGARLVKTAQAIFAAERCRREFRQETLPEIGKDSTLPLTKQGLEWLEKNFDSAFSDLCRPWKNVPDALHPIVRMADATGRWYLGRCHLKKEMVKVLLASQQADGSWIGDSPCTSTAMALMVFAQITKTTVLGHLQYDGDWNNRPEAMGNLTGWLTRTLCGSRLQWQTVRFDAPLDYWLESPLLVITGSRDPKFTLEQMRWLAEYVYHGGTLLSIAEGLPVEGGSPFTKGMEALYKKLFPRWPMHPPAPSNSVYDIYFKVKPQDVPLREIGNGFRLLAVHCEKDLTASWQLRKVATKKVDYDAFVNILMCVTDKGRGFRGFRTWNNTVFGLGTTPLGGPRADVRAIKIVRLRFDGNCEPEPLALEHFAQRMEREDGNKVEVGEPAAIEKLGADYDLAILSGTGKLNLSAEDKASLKRYVTRGATLLVSASDKEFADSAKSLIEELWGKNTLTLLPTNAALYQLADGDKKLFIEKFRYTRKAAVRLGDTKEPLVRSVIVNKRPAVFFSREDLVEGLLGVACYGRDGYDPNTSFAIMRNLVIGLAMKKNLAAVIPAPARASAPATALAGE